jgi:hypothetical protein
MGFFSRFKNPFSKKKKEILHELPELPPTPSAVSPITHGAPTEENVRAKMDLLIAQIDSLRIQYETINERVTQIEKMVKELLDMAHRS